MRVGDHLDVHVPQDANDLPVMPVPTSTNPGVLRVTARHEHDATVTFVAMQRGTTDLTTRTVFCIGNGERQRVRPCVALHVTVTK